MELKLPVLIFLEQRLILKGLPKLHGPVPEAVKAQLQEQQAGVSEISVLEKV